MKLSFLREQMNKKYKNIYKEYIYDLEALEKIISDILPPFLGAKANQIIKWINIDYTSRTNTDLYAHRSINDLIYALHYLYGVKFFEDENGLVTEELTSEEFRLLVEYSEFLFQKYYFGLTNEEFEEIYYREQIEAETLSQEQMEQERMEALFID
jgi:hypothetical protein